MLHNVIDSSDDDADIENAGDERVQSGKKKNTMGKVGGRFEC